MKFGPAVTLTLRRYAVFAGRASRSECWWFVVFNLGIGLAAAAVGNAMQDPDALRALSLLVLLPWITLAVRRLHDIDRTGWWVLLGLLPRHDRPAGTVLHPGNARGKPVRTVHRPVE